jgi:hypothetical protein
MRPRSMVVLSALMTPGRSPRRLTTCRSPRPEGTSRAPGGPLWPPQRPSSASASASLPNSCPLLIDGEKVPAAVGLGPLPPAPTSLLDPHTTWDALAGFGIRPCSHDGKSPSPDWPGGERGLVPGLVDTVVSVGDGVDTQHSPERILPMPSVTAPLSRLTPLPSDHRQRSLSVASPPFRLRGCWQTTIDRGGRESLVCRWILVPA